MISRFLAFCCALVCGLASSTWADTAKQPNIIFMMTDDQGYGDFACHGHPFLKTPHLDRMHAQSTRFTNYHVSPTCAPTRAALMSGVNPFEAGVTHTILERERMNPELTTVAQVLQGAGYATGIFGKWHLGEQAEYQPDNRGFDEVFIHGAGGIGQSYPGAQGDAPGTSYFGPTILHNGQLVKTTGFCTDVFVQQALSWMRDQKEKPFFAYIPTNAPHGPFLAPDKYKEMYRDKVGQGKRAKNAPAFFGMITNIDDNVGLIMDKLDEWGLADNTIFIYSTDNGSALGAGIWNAGMKGGKGSLNEGGSRVPLFVRWPGVAEAGQDEGQLARHIDIFPTLADIAGADISDLKLEGRSLAPIIKGSEVEWPDRQLFFHSGRWNKAGAAGRWGQGDTDPDSYRLKKYAVRTEKWRLVGPNQLYDIVADPAEQNNVYNKHPEVVKELQAAYEAFWDRARPKMVNEDAPLDVPKPLVELHKKQMAGDGIPAWPVPEL